MTAAMFTALSLGAGVQSTTLALASARGVLPQVDHAIFADTGWEPAEVYAHLHRLTPILEAAGIPVHVVSAGNIRADALDPHHRFASMPMFVRGDPWTCDTCNGAGRVARSDWVLGDDPEDATDRCDACGGAGGGTGLGMLRRQCTSEYKLKPIKAKVRELLGAHVTVDSAGRRRVGRVPGAPGQRHAINWVGISTDEVDRIKPSDVQYLRRQDPLVDVLGWSRDDCETFLAEHWPFDVPVPRSACIGCPFHSNYEWRHLRDDAPDDWADAVEFDAAIRGARAISRGDALLGEAFLHADRVPLADANIDKLGRRERKAMQGTLPGCSPFGCERSTGAPA